MSKKKLYIVSLSGGKDSTAMLLRLVEEGYPIDYILFCDTTIEFPEMYEHLKRVEQYIGREITYLRAEHDFEFYFSEYMPKRKNPELMGKVGMSWAGPVNRWCTGMLKVRIVKRYLRELAKQYEIVEYVGIAADEQERTKGKCYPLIEWGMTEKDCLQYCYDRGFDWGGLYEIFNRVSCWCCPLQSIDELRKLYVHFPHLWSRLEKWDEGTWRQFRADYSVKDLRLRFELEKEWQSKGLEPKGKAFFKEYRELLRRAYENQDKGIPAYY